MSWKRHLSQKEQRTYMYKVMKVISVGEIGPAYKEPITLLWQGSRMGKPLTKGS